MDALALVSALLIMVPAVLGGYFRYRAPEENAGIVLLAVGFACGFLFLGVQAGIWGLLLIQIPLVAITSAWAIRRLRVIGVNS